MKGARCIRGMGVPPRWKWEKSGIILVCGMEGIKDSEKDIVVKTINDMIKEFKFPLKVERCSPVDEEEIRNIVTKYPREGTVDDEEVLKFLNEIRRNSQKFPQAIVVIIGQKYKPLRNWEPLKGIYGIGDDDGLVLLRFTCKEAIRHEVGHMFGLGHHHEGNSNPDCIMNYECPSTQFCHDCKNELQGIWEEELKGKH